MDGAGWTILRRLLFGLRRWNRGIGDRVAGIGDRGSGNLAESDETVASLAELYLGNILYALERCALSLSEQGDAEGAAYYRGLAKALADARGREKTEPHR